VEESEKSQLQREIETLREKMDIIADQFKRQVHEEKKFTQKEDQLKEKRVNISILTLRHNYQKRRIEFFNTKQTI
jgi:hypothetical protein